MQLSRRLLTLTVAFGAIITQAITSGARLPLPCWDVAARRAGVVVVVHPMSWLLLSFVDGMKSGYSAHIEPHKPRFMLLL